MGETLQMSVEDAIQIILRCLRGGFPAGDGSDYGYGVYLPKVARAYLMATGRSETWQEAEYLWRPISRTFYAAAWELCRRGILRPGVREAGLQATDDGSGGNGYSVTPFGEEWIREAIEADLIPLEPSRFAQMLAERGQRFGAGFVERSQEAVRAYSGRAFLACCAMCGAAAESVLLAVAIKKNGDESAILNMYASRGGRGRVEKSVLGNQSVPVQEEFYRYTTLLKHWRDSAAHGRAVSITEPEAYSSLALLLRFAIFSNERWDELTV